MKGKVSNINYSFWQLDSERKEMEGTRRQESPPLQKRSKAGMIQDSRCLWRAPLLGILVELESLVDRPCFPIATVQG